MSGKVMHAIKDLEMAFFIEIDILISLDVSDFFLSADTP
tara:strand:- start:330 stop:446 length:117 start_codon:yes stop_codon:yes gene_type:complete